MNLTSVKNVEEEEAELLRENNIDYLEDLAGARCVNIEDMGLSSDMVADALKKVGYRESVVDPREIPYTCEYCGKEFHAVQHVTHERHVELQCGERPEAQTDFAESV